MICAICKKTGDKILLFDTVEKLNKCRRMLAARKKHQMRFCDVVLPDDINSDIGYHSKCYANFTAVGQKYLDEESVVAATPENRPVSPQPSTSHTSSETEVMEQDAINDEGNDDENDDLEIIEPQLDAECFFCEKRRKQHHGKEQKLYATKKGTVTELIQKYCKLNDADIMWKRFQNLNGDTFFYHNICKMSIVNKCKAIEKETPPTDWHTYRRYHELAFDELSEFIEENILTAKKIFFLSHLHSIYMTSVKAIAEEHSHEYEAEYTAHQLQKKIEKNYGKNLRIVNMHNRIVIMPKDSTIPHLIFQQLEESEQIQKVALLLRKTVLKITKKPFSSDISVQDLIAGECSIPDNLKDFCYSLFGGTNRRRHKSTACQRIVKSVAEDIIYNVSNGSIKTSKHVTLGLSLKSLTSSRKIIDIINRYGHCCSYHTIEELETEATFSSSNSSTLCPPGIIHSPNLHTGVAFDNFDRYVETVNGKDTLHDTVGIIYQDVMSETNEEEECAEESEREPEVQPEQIPTNTTETVNRPRRRRRRTFDAIAPELTPYLKKPKMMDLLLPNEDCRQLSATELDITIIRNIDLIWMLSHAFKVPNLPMWAGFNSQIIDDQSLPQKICYLTPVNLSPTDKTVVFETLKQSQKIAEEVKQPFIQVTYDLAIAKIAMQIQSEEKPRFNNIFIHLGGFHIMMAYFKTIGKFINDCGLTTIMMESDLLASGSISGFIEGKHFNRCKRLHPMMALGLEILHFRSYLEIKNIEINDEIVSEVTSLWSNKSPNAKTNKPSLKNLLTEYSEYQEDTLKGEFGLTQKFYMIYIKLVHYYLYLSRSFRTGDFNLYKWVLPKITNLFFSCNQQNYARWLVKYYDNLLKVEEEYPELYEAFKNGFFGVKQTNKAFSRQPIDLTLEQTVNADAAKRLTGILHFTNSISARQRWAKSHDIRTSVISYTYNETGIKKKQDISSDLEKHSMRQSSLQLQRFLDAFSKYINPFSSALSRDFLFNICSGKAASEEVADYLLNIETIGDNLRKKFISQCSTSTVRFEQAIKKVEIRNFSSELGKKK